MRLTIAIVAKDGRPCDGPTAEFDENGGTIGRRADCTLVIADEQRHISRVHALVELRGDYFCIVDKGSYIAVRVNGLRVGRGQETPIFEGDEIVIGGYTMRVTDVAAAWDLDATLAVPALTVRDRTPPPVPPAVEPQAPAAVAGTAAGDRPADTDGVSADGDATPKRAARGRRRPRRGPPTAPALETLSDNPTATHEPGRTLPPEESVARILAAEVAAGRIVPDFDLSGDADPPGGSVAERPGHSTFDLLADRLLEKGDLAYDPFMPKVWEEGRGADDRASAVPEAVPVRGGDGEGAGPSVPVTVHVPGAAPPEPIVVPTFLAEIPASELPASLMAEAEAVVKEVVGDELVTVAAGTAEADAAARDVLEGEVVDSAAASEPAGAGDGAPPGVDGAVLDRVVRRRRRRDAAEAALVVDASVVETAPAETDRPEIVLVLQPMAAGDAGELVVPIRRRNRRTARPAAG